MTARPQTVTVAVVLQVLLSFANLASSLFPLEGMSEFVVYLGVALGVAGLLASAGLWMLRKWSI
jgi:sorbitol-specific phosphotransferase system component IIC